MTSHLHLVAWGTAGLALAGLAMVSCTREPPTTRARPSPSASVSHPPDRLEAGEIAEGHQVAFSLKIPRGMRVTFRGPMSVEAEGPYSAERVANYIRKRITAQSVELGAARTVFENAQVNGAEKPRPIRVEVIPQRNRTRLVVRDMTPLKTDPLLSEEERWKRFGFDPKGRILDPKRLE